MARTFACIVSEIMSLRAVYADPFITAERKSSRENRVTDPVPQGVSPSPPQAHPRDYYAKCLSERGEFFAHLLFIYALYIHGLVTA